MLSLLGCLTVWANAQQVGNPFITPADEKILDEQAVGLFEAVRPLAEEAASRSVTVKAGRKTLALGTVTSKGIVTKWSEVKAAAQQLSVVTSEGNRLSAQVRGVFPEYDLALLEVDFAPVGKWKHTEKASLGEVLVLAGPSKQARGLGVVSVEERSLQVDSRGFLGVAMEGREVSTEVTHVVENSAAHRFGLKEGDVLLAIDQQPVKNKIEVLNFLQKKKPKQRVELKLRRGDTIEVVTVVLDARKIRERKSSRMQTMENMGTRTSRVDDDFPAAIQSDMDIDVKDCGGPVVNLKGELVGVVLARASRIKTYILPADKLEDLLQDQ